MRAPSFLLCLAVAVPSSVSALRAGDSADCLACHSQPDQKVSYRTGETHTVTIDEKAWASSVHGQGGLECLTCHEGHAEYPHPALGDETHRDHALRLTVSCRDCHEGQYTKTMDSVHRRALAKGHKEAAVCVDCHDPHTQARITNAGTKRLLAAARLAIPQTCARCHGPIYDDYKQSAHGAALVGQGNPDVPTCIDCHGVHDIHSPLTARFRLDSPQMCARCHTDERRMAKYGLSTAVLKTYVADFHGTTVTLFRKQRPDQETNKPVCFDCHGVHDIAKTGDPERGLKVKARLLKTCQQCHPSATPSFPDAWMSHFVPARDRARLVFWAGWFYRILIPATVGSMLAYVGTDFVRRRLDEARARRAAAAPPPPPEDET